MSETVQASERPRTAEAFHYEAQGPAGHTLSGELRAADVTEARTLLERLGLHVLSVAPVEPTAPPRRAGAVRGADFQAFNQQLAQLTAAGLPVERGLRLIARDMRSRRMAESVDRVAAELERGMPLGEAFEIHRHRFPALYGRLVEAGVRSGQLPQVLFNLGRHLELIGRLRGELWRGLTYPLLLIAAMLLLLGFFAAYIAPAFKDVYADFAVELPALTNAVLAMAPLGPVLLAAAVAMALGVPLMVEVLRWTGLLPRLVDVLVRVPLLGPVLHRSRLARWCDALRIGVDAGLDLPAALSLASEAVASPALARDAERLRQTLEAGRPIDEHVRLKMLPGAVPASIAVASERGDLPTMLGHLAELYQQQAEMRLAVLQVALTPAMLVVATSLIGLLLIAMFLPLITLMESLL